MDGIQVGQHEVVPSEHVLLSELRRLRRAKRREHRDAMATAPSSSGQKVADKIVKVMGSWTFIVAQSALLVCWVSANLLGARPNWDPYPFILLNLALSFQSAYAAPLIMMSQNRQQEMDRGAAETDYLINVKAELEIELLHEKLDYLRTQEISQLVEAVRRLSELVGPAAKRIPTSSDDATDGSSGA